MPQSHITVEWTLVEADAARKRRHDRSAAPLVNAKQPLRGWRWWLKPGDRASALPTLQ